MPTRTITNPRYLADRAYMALASTDTPELLARWVCYGEADEHWTDHELAEARELLVR